MNPQEKAKLNELLKRLKEIYSSGLTLVQFIEGDKKNNRPTLERTQEGLLRAGHSALKGAINDLEKLLKRA